MPKHYRLTHPDLDFYVDVTVHERDGRYMATADLAEDSRDVGVGDTPQEAVQGRAAEPGRAVRERDGGRGWARLRGSVQAVQRAEVDSPGE